MAPPPDLWRIYHVAHCAHARPAPKAKLVVIVCRDALAMGFLINSEIDPWIQISKERMACQAPIRAEEHPGCLTYDGYVDCLELYPFEDFELTEPRDAVSENLRAAILASVRNAITIPCRYRRLILNE